MIVTSIGIIILIIIILLIGKIINRKKRKESDGIIVVLLIWAGLPIILSIIICGIAHPTKMGEWEVKEAIESTLLDNKEESIFNEYTYQYIIPERWSTKPNVINYTVDNLSEDVPPILVKCERKAEPTIWTLGLGYKETKYVFYNSDDTISEVELK